MDPYSVHILNFHDCKSCRFPRYILRLTAKGKYIAFSLSRFVSCPVIFQNYRISFFFFL